MLYRLLDVKKVNIYSLVSNVSFSPVVAEWWSVSVDFLCVSFCGTFSQNSLELHGPVQNKIFPFCKFKKISSGILSGSIRVFIFKVSK